MADAWCCVAWAWACRISELSKLQDAVPPTAFPYVERTVKSELGPSLWLCSMPLVPAELVIDGCCCCAGVSLKAAFARFDETPIAAASIAQVRSIHGPAYWRCAL